MSNIEDFLSNQEKNDKEQQTMQDYQHKVKQKSF
jgi:hypothetical protein